MDLAAHGREPARAAAAHRALGFDAVELPLENAGDLDPACHCVRCSPSTGLAPYVVGAMAPGRDLVATVAESVSTTQDYLRACVDLAAADRRTPAVCGPFYAQTGRVWRMSADEREAAYAEWRDAPRTGRRPTPPSAACGSASSRSTATRPRWSTPSTRR